jgi:hypothetical protein
VRRATQSVFLPLVSEVKKRLESTVSKDKVDV